jgi:hypothetical protein
MEDVEDSACASLISYLRAGKQEEMEEGEKTPEGQGEEGENKQEVQVEDDRPQIRNIPRDTPIPIHTSRDTHHMDRYMGKDVHNNHAHNPGTHNNLAHNPGTQGNHDHNPGTQGNHAHPRTKDARNPRTHEIVLGLEQPPLRIRKLTAQ